MRLVLLVLLSLAIPSVFGATASFSGSVPNGRTLVYLYEVDLGTSPTSITFTATLESLSSAGLIGSVVDVDAFSTSASTDPTSVNEQTVIGTGTVNCTVNNTYAGTRCFALTIETASGTTSSAFSATITTTASTVSEVGFSQIINGSIGLKIAVGKFAQSYRTVGAGQLLPTGVELDFGSTSQTAYVRFEASGNGLNRIELIDTTGGSATILQTFTGPLVDNVAAIPLTHSGRATLRVNVVGSSGSSGDAFWRLTVPCSVHASVVGVESSSDDDSDGGCTLHKSNQRNLTLVGLVALISVIRRRKRLPAGL
ncbi:MAG: hypothetical protein ACYTDT_08315 [Planctomycetota bacterium]|jgi:hypothetical protein